MNETVEYTKCVTGGPLRLEHYLAYGYVFHVAAPGTVDTHVWRTISSLYGYPYMGSSHMAHVMRYPPRFTYDQLPHRLTAI